MHNRTATVDIVRWVNLNEQSAKPVQCMSCTTNSDYETLCGFAIAEEEDLKSVKVISRRQGRVTCPHCLAIIDAVLKG